MRNQAACQNQNQRVKGVKGSKPQRPNAPTYQIGLSRLKREPGKARALAKNCIRLRDPMPDLSAK